MNWLSVFYLKHPEYRKLRVAKRTPTSVHFELEPGLYEAHFQIKPIFDRVASGLWLPAGQFAALGRIVAASVCNPRFAAQMAMSLPFATALTLQPGATAGKDTTVVSTSPTLNYGVYTDRLVYVASWKGLIEFDVSSIPASATCKSATLSVFQCVSGAALAFTLTLYSIAVGNAAWIEGTQNGTLAAAGEPCWNALAADGAGGVTTPWAGSAGLSTSGTDYETVSLGSVSGNRSGPNGTEYAAALTASRVQGWFAVSNSNYGVLVLTNAGVGGIATSDHATAAYRPKLVVEYTLPAGGAVFNAPFAAAFRGAFG